MFSSDRVVGSSNGFIDIGSGRTARMINFLEIEISEMKFCLCVCEFIKVTFFSKIQYLFFYV